MRGLTDVCEPIDLTEGLTVVPLYNFDADQMFYSIYNNGKRILSLHKITVRISSP